MKITLLCPVIRGHLCMKLQSPKKKASKEEKINAHFGQRSLYARTDDRASKGFGPALISFPNFVFYEQLIK